MKTILHLNRTIGNNTWEPEEFIIVSLILHTKQMSTTYDTKYRRGSMRTTIKMSINRDLSGQRQVSIRSWSLKRNEIRLDQSQEKRYVSRKWKYGSLIMYRKHHYELTT
ncbi:hypothetical protein FA15DRAFT_288539 [Coprinopsis marcescibilis]|uniref:Uncharacterized protein n=1 Tax=Coprinopsis marcescibilis TaxID=230819 RepID=A0A5C3LCQ0_COPMA|nr:hypothetical protein FA15DRAFT_288539 [Coprinopsis marcescibilis]